MLLDNKVLLVYLLHQEPKSALNSIGHSVYVSVLPSIIVLLNAVSKTGETAQAISLCTMSSLLSSPTMNVTSFFASLIASVLQAFF